VLSIWDKGFTSSTKNEYLILIVQYTSFLDFFMKNFMLNDMIFVSTCLKFILSSKHTHTHTHINVWPKGQHKVHIYIGQQLFHL